MNNVGFSLYEQLEPTNKDINISYKPTTSVIRYEYYIIKDGIRSNVFNINGMDATNIVLSDTGNYQIEVKTYDYYGTNTIKSGIYKVDKEAPVINIIEEEVELEMGTHYDFLNNVRVNDNYDGDLTAKVMINDIDLNSVGEKYINYTAVDQAGNQTVQQMSVNVVNNKTNGLFYIQIIVGLLLVIFICLAMLYYRTTKLIKRIGRYGLNPINDNSPSLLDQIISFYTNLLETISKYLNKSVFLVKYSKRYEKYLGIVNTNYKQSMNYVASKLIVSLVFLLIAIISNVFQFQVLGLYEVFLSLIVGFFVPDFLYLYKYKRYRGNLENDFLQAIIIMNNAFKSGRSISQAVDIVAKELDGPMALEFKKMGLELSFGLSVDIVFNRFAERVNLEEAKYLTASISILNKTGGNIIKVFSSIEKTLFSKKKLRLEMQSLTGASRIIVYVLIAIPLLFIVFISLISPDYFLPLITTELGYIITSIIIVVYILYIFFVFKIMKVRM